MKQVVERFAEKGYAPPAMFADLEIYVRTRAGYDAMGRLFAKASDALVSRAHGSARFLLSKIRVHSTEGFDRTRIGKVCGVLTADDVGGFPWTTDFLKFAKGGAVLVFPLYAARNAISGFYAVNKQGASEIFVLDELEPVHYLGLTGVPARGTDHAILVTSIDDAAQVLATVAINAIGAEPIIAAVLTAKDSKPAVLTGIGVTAVTVWSNDVVEAYRWAVLQPVATIAMETRGLPEGNPAAVGPYLRDVVSTSMSVFRAVAVKLADLSTTEAALVFRQLNLDTNEINCLVAATPQSIKPFITTLIAGESAAPKGVYDGRPVAAADTGWVFTDTNTPISNFTLTLQETWAGADGPMVRGVVSTAAKTLSFEELLLTVQAKTLVWLTNVMTKNGMPIPHVYIPKLRRAVFDIAMSFGHPQARRHGDAVHWDGNALVLPGFTITAAGEYTTRTDADAGLMASASLFRPPPMLDDRHGFPDADTLWSILIYIAVNVTHHIHGHRAPGIVLAGDGREAWTTALRDALGLSVKGTAFPAGTCAQETESVFPTIVAISSEASYLEWIADERHNAILSSPRLGLRVLRYLRWFYVVAEAPPSAAAVAAIPQVVNLIKLIITNSSKIPVKTAAGSTPYYAVAQILAAAYPGAHAASIGRVATTLGVTYRYGKGADSDSLRLTGSVYDLHCTGDLAVTAEADGSVVVNWNAYTKAMERHGITAVTRDKALSIYRSKRGAKLNSPPDCVVIAAEEWSAAEQWAGVMV